ncbi:hypothetical protein SAPIO_CDS10914 [Scedosporium apiospermum]|uniref:Uncharacterized protein n=1 Tax=Pseudallescheria apiosperma TaxID=563466 RepID=A0A084FUV0_PSEDA|nr:uncharacterized protein SAPIO_CDS10914 [Scedosporium apiospermum]KEZ38862.1 hypothetical protein SAPIO_CDS10914 [Scedosporium apiospermum]
MVAPWGESPRRPINLPFANNCSATASYVSGLLLGKTSEPSFRDVSAFFTAMFPTRNLSNDTILEYHDYVWDSRVDRYDYGDALEPCRSQVCKAINLKVDNTGIGIGTIVSVGLEALLVLGYCVMAIALYTRTVPGEPKIPPASHFTALDRIIYAFYGTTRHFFICAIILCLGTSIGLITDGAYIMKQRDDDFFRPYGHQFLVACIAFFSLAATIPAYLWGSRRQWVDAPLLVVTWILSAVAIAFSAVGPRSYNDSFDRVCPDDFFPLSGTLPAAHGVGAWCPVLFALCIGCVLPFFRCGGRKMWANRVIRRAMRTLIVIYAVLGFIGAFAYLILLYVFIGKTTWIGDSKWDMGQGLALALWVPLLYELVHLMSVGIDKGLTASLPREFDAVREDDLDDDAEPVFIPGMAPGPRGDTRYEQPPAPGGAFGQSVGLVPQMPPAVVVPEKGSIAAQLREASTSQLTYRFA